MRVGPITTFPCIFSFALPSSLPQQQQRPETAKDDQSIIHAETRQNTTWLPPPVVPVANKPGGTAVGFMGKTAAGERWLLKLGMDKTEGHKATASILSKSVAVRGMSTDAIQEVVATTFLSSLPQDVRDRVTATAGLGDLVVDCSIRLLRSGVPTSRWPDLWTSGALPGKERQHDATPRASAGWEVG